MLSEEEVRKLLKTYNKLYKRKGNLRPFGRACSLLNIFVTLPIDMELCGRIKALEEVLEEEEHKQ